METSAVYGSLRSIESVDFSRFPLAILKSDSEITFFDFMNFSYISNFNIFI